MMWQADKVAPPKKMVLGAKCRSTIIPSFWMAHLMMLLADVPSWDWFGDVVLDNDDLKQINEWIMMLQ